VAIFFFGGWVGGRGDWGLGEKDVEVTGTNSLRVIEELAKEKNCHPDDMTELLVKVALNKQ
jgi:hypothetical protein